LLRGNVVAERKKEYIQSAFSVGVPNRRILFRHLLPNVTRGLFVLITSDIGAVVVLVAVFNFLGLTGGAIGGALADWGEMLRLNRDWIITPSNAFEYWYTFLPPSLAIVFFAMGWSLIGDGLRDVLDPRLR
jgi:peptide/nickel transport system permease protein